MKKLKSYLVGVIQMCEFCDNIAKNDEEFGKIRMNDTEKDFIFFHFIRKIR